MKLKHLLCSVFLTTTGIAVPQLQTTKTPPPTKKPTGPAHKSPAQQLPFSDARSMTVIVLWQPPPVPPAPGMPPLLSGRPSPIGSGVWIGKTGSEQEKEVGQSQQL